MYKSGLYPGALQMFQDAYAATKEPRLMVRIGQTLLQLQRSSEALNHCKDFLRQYPDAPAIQRIDAQACVDKAQELLWAQRQASGAPADPVATPPAPTPTPAAPTPPPRALPPAPPVARPAPAPAAKPSPAPTSASDPIDSLLSRPESSAGTLSSPPTTSRPVTDAPPPAPVPPPLPESPPTAAGAGAAATLLPAPSTTPLPEVGVLPAPAAAAVKPTVGFEALLRDCYEAESQGKGPLAQACFQRFLTQQPDVPPDNVARLNRQLAIAAIGSLPARRNNPGMWGAGLTLLLSSWVPSATFGVLFAQQVMSSPVPTGMGPEVHYSLLAPVVGPLIEGFIFIGRDPDRTSVIREWAVPWLTASGITQIVGFSLFVAGLQSRPGPLGLDRLPVSIAPYATATGGGVGASGRF